MWTRRELLWGGAGLWVSAPAWAKSDPLGGRWLGRDLKMSTARGLVGAAVDAFSQSPSVDAAVRVARYAFWAGLMLERGGAGKSERRAVYTRGLQFAEKARRLDAKHPGGHYYDAVHRAKRGELKGVTSSVMELPDLVERMGYVYEVDRTYHFGGPDRFWGTIIANTPSLVLSMQGSSLEKGEAHFKSSAKIAPSYCGTYFEWAKLRQRTDGDAGRRAMLQRCVDVPAAKEPAIEAWNRFDRQKARRALKSEN